MHRSDGTAATSGDWGDRTHPNVRARVGATYKTPRSVFGFASLLTREGEPHQLCVRSLLAKTEARIESLAPGVSVGYELEFFCDEEAAPAGLSPHADFDLYGARLSGGVGFRLLDFLIAQGPPATDSIQHFCKEYEAGQYEIGTVPASPLAAADRMVLVRELLKTCSAVLGVGDQLAAPALQRELWQRVSDQRRRPNALRRNEADGDPPRLRALDRAEGHRRHTGFLPLSFQLRETEKSGVRLRQRLGRGSSRLLGTAR